MRNVFYKKIISGLAVFTLLLQGLSLPVYAEGKDIKITILHTNDVHGSIVGSDSSIGLDRVASIKKEAELEGENPILVDAGDATQGLPIASLTQGSDIIQLMNAAGYDLMAAGNHEFDYGTEIALENASLADFPVISANIYKDNAPLFQSDDDNGCHVIIEKEGKKLGFFGLTTASTATATNPTGIQDLEFRDEIEAAKSEIDELEEAGCDVIIAVAHLGEYTTVPCDSAALANAMTGEYQGDLDIIIDGHSHTKEDKVVNDVHIVQTGTGLTELGRITLDFSSDDTLTIEVNPISYEDAQAITPDSDISGKIDEINTSQQAMLAEEIGSVTNSMWGGYINYIAEARIVETNLGDFTADAFRDAAQNFIADAEGMADYQDLPVIGVENGGGIRAFWSNGTLTKGDLVSAFPFSNTLMMKEITPSILYQILEQSVYSITGQSSETGMLEGEPFGGFLQVSGIRFSYSPSAETGSKVTAVYLTDSDTPLDRQDTSTRLILVSNNYIMSGGSDYDMLASLPLIGEIGGELETIENYVDTQISSGTVPLEFPMSQDRITIDGDLSPDTFTATIIVTKEGVPAADTEVSYYLDGTSEPIFASTDSEGKLIIEIPKGPHALTLSKDQPQVYLNNYTGAGIINIEDERVYPSVEYQTPAEKPANNAFIWGLMIAMAVVEAGIAFYTLKKENRH